MEGASGKRQKLEWKRELLSDPSVFLQLGEVRHVGRALSEKILGFIDIPCTPQGYFILGADEKAPMEDVFAVEEVGFYGFRFIVGPGGTGKSTSLCAAFTYLSNVYSAESPVTRRIVFISGAEAAKNAEAAVASAIGFSGDHSRIRQFFKQSDVRYTLIVDDGNQVPTKGDAALFLATLVPPCKVVLCASASCDWMEIIRKPKTRRYLIVNENLEGKELEAFCQRYSIDFQKVDSRRTGTNPRLLLLYSRNLEEFEEHVFAVKKSAGEFLAQAVLNLRTRVELLKDMTGVDKVRRLSPVNDTKCLFVGENGMLDCISEELQQYCSRSLAQVIEEADINAAVELVGIVTGAIRRDRNLIRIGWNAEEATLLAVKLLALTFYYQEGKSISLGRPSFTLFDGEMSAEVLTKPLPRLYAPSALTHIGLDFFVETDEAMIAFQVSVAKNAVARHHHTRPKAEKLFQAAGKPTNILVFVTPGGYSSELRRTPEGCEYYSVTMPFAYLSANHLAVIDETVAAIRGSAAKQDKCSKCDEVTGCDNWVQCDVCLLWYHFSCVGFKETLECYECYQCEDFMKRKRSLRRPARELK